MGRTLRIGAFALAACLMAGAAAAPGPVTLKAQPPVSRQADAFPRIAQAASPQAGKVNAALVRADARLRAAVADCKDSAKTMEQGWSWERQVSAPMRGAGFLSLLAIDGTGCGGAHPNSDQIALTYDLGTGAPIDWARYLPKDLATPTERATAGDGTVLGVVTSPTLLEWYRPAALRSLDGDLAKDCKDVLDTSVSSLTLWLDAKRGGVAMVATGLPHVVAACAAEAVMPVAELKRRGASPALTGAIVAAHNATAWTDGF